MLALRGRSLGREHDGCGETGSRESVRPERLPDHFDTPGLNVAVFQSASGVDQNVTTLATGSTRERRNVTAAPPRTDAPVGPSRNAPIRGCARPAVNVRKVVP